MSASGAFGITMAVEQTAPTASMVSLTDPEVATLAKDRGISPEQARQRIVWQQHARDLADQLQKAFGNRFGGLWIAPSDGDRLKVGIVGGNADVRSYAQKWGLAAVTDVVPVRYSLELLEAANSQIGDALVRANAGAMWPLEAGIDTSRNAVILHLPSGKELTPTEQAVVADAQHRYGTAVRVESYHEGYKARACNYGNDCDPPLRGGVRTTSTYGGRCTVGFNAKSKTDSKPYVIIAGHCRVNLNVEIWLAYFANLEGHVIGHWHHIIWDSSGDMGIIDVDNPSGWSPRPWVWVHNDPAHNVVENQSYYITSDGGSSLNMRACMSGSLPGNEGPAYTTCGTVLELDFTATYNGTTVQHLARTDALTYAGASGGPVYSGHVGYGIIAAGNEYETLYQGIRGAEGALNVTILTGAG